MNVLREYLNLGLGALFLNEDAYSTMREDAHRIRKGFGLIVLVGVSIALAALVGKILEWGTTPDLSNLPNLVLKELESADWWKSLEREPKALEQFNNLWNLGWQIFKPLMGVDVFNALLNVLLNPLVLVLRWLVYGIGVFICARMLGGKATFSQTLGCTALAVAPEMLNVAQIVPYVQLAGIGTWGLVCAYLGVKTANQLTPWRAFGATLLPFSILIGAGILGGCCAGVALTTLAGGK